MKKYAPMRRAMSRDACAGFTLLELLIGLLLVSLVLTLISTVLFSARRLLEQSSSEQSVSPLFAAGDVLRLAIGEARAVPSLAMDETADDTAPLVFAGSSERMRFVSAFAPGDFVRGLYDVEVAVVGSAKQPGTKDLLWVGRLHRPDPDPSLAASGVKSSTLLIRNIEHIDIKFFGSLEDGQARNWHAQWSHPERLPELVSVELRFLPGDPRGHQSWYMPIWAAGATSLPCPPRSLCH